MKSYKIILCALFFILLSSTLSAQKNDWGVGIILGEPTGISAKYWTNPVNAFHFGLGYSFVNKGRLHIHADYVWHVENLFETTETLIVYYGPGARIKTKEDSDARFGVRWAVGLIWIPRDAPVDVFVELVPLLDLIPSTDVSVNAGIGFRYFFR